MLIVTQPFIGHGYDYPQPGELIDPPEPKRSAILAAGVAVEYETKIEKPPLEVKKKERSASSQAAPRQTKKTPKKRTKKSK